MSNGQHAAGQQTPARSTGIAAVQRGNGSWLYCAGCGNPCRAPARPGEYVCPRCGRRLAAGRAAVRTRAAVGAVGATARRAAFVISLIMLVALAGIGATVSRMARAEGKSLITEGLTEDPFMLDGDAIYLRTYRSLRRAQLSGAPAIALTRGRLGLYATVVADGWVYWVTRPWGPYQGIFEIRRAPAGGGPEERVAQIGDDGSYPRGIAVVSGRLYVLLNERAGAESWRARLLRIDPTGRRESLLLVDNTLRPPVEFVVDRDDPDRVLWLSPDVWTPEKEISGALYEASFRRGSGSGAPHGCRRLLTIRHPYGLAQEEGRIYWFNVDDDLYNRRTASPGVRFGAPRPASPTDSVQLQVLPRGSRRLEIYPLSEPPAGFRGMLYHDNFYWLALREAPSERETRADVLRMSLATRSVSAVTHLRSGGLGPTCWFLRDRADHGLFLAERYLYDNWLDWSARGLSPKQFCRIWRLKTD
jgi:hypothetical protein